MVDQKDWPINLAQPGLYRAMDLMYCDDFGSPDCCGSCHDDDYEGYGMCEVYLTDIGADYSPDAAVTIVAMVCCRTLDWLEEVGVVVKS